MSRSITAFPWLRCTSSRSGFGHRGGCFLLITKVAEGAQRRELGVAGGNWTVAAIVEDPGLR